MDNAKSFDVDQRIAVGTSPVLCLGVCFRINCDSGVGIVLIKAYFCKKLKMEIMQATQTVRLKYDIISWLTELEDKRRLQELYQWIITKEKEDIVRLTSEQVDMLRMSEEDIKQGRLVAESDLNKSDEQWLF
jgi:hypothetical protein